MASHRIVGSEVGRTLTPGGGSIRMMSRPRRRLSGWGLILAPIVLIAGGIAAVVMWPFR